MPRIPPEWPKLDTDPDAQQLTHLIHELTSEDGPADEAGVWPDRLWAVLSAAGANRWALRSSLGSGLDRPDLMRRYAFVAEGSLNAAFILSQHDAAVRRLAWAAGRPRIDHWLEAIGSGQAFTTVGISQLTTSRRRGAAALVANKVAGGYQLDGAMPWVTGAQRADLFVTGAVTPHGEQLLIALPADRAGVSVHPAFPLAALQASCTAEVGCQGAFVEPDDIIAGPSADVLTAPGHAGTGGLETSALALGQARAALVGLANETSQREELSEPFEALADAWLRLASAILLSADGAPDALAPGAIRGQANDLVLRVTQAYLTARKGSGFLRTDPAQRYARQALFFLVWSCPAPVANAAIRDLAGLCTLS
jgi:alkylation response protein AidB-like acyl-CoA dehydrogenase